MASLRLLSLSSATASSLYRPLLRPRLSPPPPPLLSGVRFLTPDLPPPPTVDAIPPLAPLQPQPRPPFAPRYRRPSQGHFTSLLSRYRQARQSLEGLAVGGPAIANKDDVDRTEREFGAYHRVLALSLNLVPLAESRGWREDVLGALEGELGLLRGGDETKKEQARETARRLVEGKWIARSLSSVPSAVSLLRGLSGRGALSTFDSTFEEVLRLVSLVLEVREMELAHLEGKYLDPTARTLRTVLTAYFAHLDHLALAPPDFSVDRSGTRTLIRVGEKEVTATPEQEAVIRSPLTPGLTRVNSHAGTGKTTALVGLAERVFQETGEPAECIVRPVKLREKLHDLLMDVPPSDARHDLALMGWKACRTVNALVMHSLKEDFGYAFEEKWLEEGRFRRTRELDHASVAELLDIPAAGWEVQDKEGRMENLSWKRIAERILQGLDTFLVSADPAPSPAHLDDAASKELVVPVDTLFPLLCKLWERMCDMDDVEAPFPFDAHVKFRQQDPSFRFSGDNLWLVDEMQDFTPCERDLLLRERDHRRVVALGDPLQAIDLWRGTDDGWTRLKADLDFRLVKTQRFGPDIATVANASQQHKELSTRGLLVGSADKKTRLYRKSANERSKRVMMSTGYADLFRILLRLLNSARPPATICLQTSSNFSSKSILQLLYHAYHLYRDLPTYPSKSARVYPPHPALRGFEKWSDLTAEFSSWGDDLPRKTHNHQQVWDLVLKLGRSGYFERDDFIDSLIKFRESLVEDPSEAEVTLTLPCQAKGLEFPHVVLSPNFGQPHRTSYLPNLRHVALTRATESIEISNKVLETYVPTWGMHNFFAPSSSATTERTTCRSCRTSHSYARIGYSTPFPYPPWHIPDPSSAPPPHTPALQFFLKRLGAIVGLETSVEPANFPVCLNCASRSPYKPLKEFATFLRQSDSVVVRPSASSHGGASGSDDVFVGYVADKARRNARLKEEAREEVKMERF